MDSKKKGFKPLLVFFDEREYKRAQEDAERKLSLLDDAAIWIRSQLDIKDSDIKMKRLAADMVGYFEDLVLVAFKDANQLGLSARKLIEAKEIPISELVKIESDFTRHRIKWQIAFEGNTPLIEINKSDFELWTENERQNQIVALGNQFIKNIIDLQKNINVRVYPANISQATNGFIRYDLNNRKYFIDRQYIFK